MYPCLVEYLRLGVPDPKADSIYKEYVRRTPSSNEKIPKY